MLKAHGTHVLVDYTNFFPNIENAGNWMLSLMEQAIDESTTAAKPRGDETPSK